MECFVKAWRVEKKWLNLNVQQREAFMKEIIGLIHLMETKGAEVVTYSKCDSFIRYGSDASFFAVWLFPENDLEREFEQLLEKSGWYEFFYQENICGTVAPVTAIFESLSVLSDQT